MQSRLTAGPRPMALQPLAVAFATGMAALTLSAAEPVLAQPVTGETLAQEILSACGGLTWAELIDGTGPKIIACRLAADDAFIAAFALPIADQERVGLAFAELMRAPAEAGAPAPYPAASYLMGSRFQGYLFDYCLPGGAPATTATLETCTASVRMVAVAAQAQAAEIIPIHVQDICGAIQDNPSWRPDIVAIIDDLVARAATGTDPVMQGRIDELAAGIAACP